MSQKKRPAGATAAAILSIPVRNKLERKASIGDRKMPEKLMGRANIEINNDNYQPTASAAIDA